MRYFVFIVSILCILILPAFSRAQLNTIPSTDISVEMSPENPKPNETVSVSAVSYSTDLNGAEITWKVNGKTLQSGIGGKNFIFQVGDMNTSTTLSLSIITSDGLTIQKSYTIKPSSVDLIWESSGSVPAFYKGKIMYSHQNVITFIALPHISERRGEINAKNLIYTWKKNGSVLGSDSGYGKNVFTMTGPLISRALDIEVEVTTTDGSAGGYARTFVNPGEPSILFYEKNPLYGIEFQKALSGSIKLTGSEITVIGIPFFFGTKSLYAPELSYKWSLNGSRIDANTTETTQVFRQKPGTKGSATVSLSVEHSRKILQFTSASFNLEFGQTGSTENSL